MCNKGLHINVIEYIGRRAEEAPRGRDDPLKAQKTRRDVRRDRETSRKYRIVADFAAKASTCYWRQPQVTDVLSSQSTSHLAMVYADEH